MTRSATGSKPEAAADFRPTASWPLAWASILHASPRLPVRAPTCTGAWRARKNPGRKNRTGFWKIAWSV